MTESKTSKERYMERMKGVKSTALLEAEYRVANRYWIEQCQKALLERFIEQENQKTSSNR